MGHVWESIGHVMIGSHMQHKLPKTVKMPMNLQAATIFLGMVHEVFKVCCSLLAMAMICTLRNSNESKEKSLLSLKMKNNLLKNLLR